MLESMEKFKPYLQKDAKVRLPLEHRTVYCRLPEEVGVFILLGLMLAFMINILVQMTSF